MRSLSTDGLGTWATFFNLVTFSTVTSSVCWAKSNR
jgi:hypothetical protein